MDNCKVHAGARRKKTIIAGVWSEELLKSTYNCSKCTPRMKIIQGCPDLGASPSPAFYPDGVIWVGSFDPAEKRHAFDRCPGYYLRDCNSGYELYPTVDGVNSSFDLSWFAHYEHSQGISQADSNGLIPPKLKQAITLIESERRAHEVLSMEKQNRDIERKSLPQNKMILKGK